MAEANWLVFGGVIILLVSGVVWLSRLTAHAINMEEEPIPSISMDAEDNDAVLGDSQWFLYGNVIFSHGLIGVLVVLTAWFTRVPADAFQFESPSVSLVGIGMGVGVGLFGLNEAFKRLMPADQLVYSEQLRDLLAPDSRLTWGGLIIGVLPMVAVVEELLFRGALIGAFTVGFGVSPWFLAVVSSVGFGIGHGIQGRGGIVATGVLGGILAVVFIVTSSLTVVIVAHYVVNVMEFIVHEHLNPR